MSPREKKEVAEVVLSGHDGSASLYRSTLYVYGEPVLTGHVGTVLSKHDEFAALLNAVAEIVRKESK